MVFPDETVKEGYFENNVFVGSRPTSPSLIPEMQENKQDNSSNNQQVSDVSHLNT